MHDGLPREKAQVGFLKKGKHDISWVQDSRRATTNTVVGDVRFKSGRNMYATLSEGEKQY